MVQYTVLGLRIRCLDRGDVAEQPCLAFFYGNAKSGLWLGVARIQDGEEFVAKCFQTLVVQVANHNHRCRGTGEGVGKYSPMPY